MPRVREHSDMASSKPPKTAPAEPEETGEQAPASVAPPVASPPPPYQGNRFFSWIRGTGIRRQPGWLGGVAAGIGVRLGIDPIIVRGIIVVIGVLGGPALLLYAAAWLLLPDTNDRIHAEELGRGRFEPAVVGIGVMVLLSLLPLSQGFWYLGAVYWGDPSWAAAFGRVLWTALVLTAIVVFVIWIARRASSEPIVTPATTDDRPDTIPVPVAPDAGQAAQHAARATANPTADSPTDPTTPEAAAAAAQDGTATLAAATLAAPAPPPAPAPGADADELDAWKLQQAEWKRQHTEWKAQQSATEREVREQRAAEARERALAASAEYAEQRRLRRLANPRINAATAFSVLGAAIVGGGIAALVASGTPSLTGYEVTVALAVAAVVLGLGIIVAGLCRRRSGVLGFFAVLVVIATLVSAAVPRDRVLLLGNGGGVGVGETARYAQLFGSLSLWASPMAPRGVTDVWQGAGTIDLQVAEGAGVRVEVRSRSGSVHLYDLIDDDGDGNSEYEPSRETDAMHKAGDEWLWSGVIGADSPGIPTLRIWQGSGSIYLYDQNSTTPTDEEATP
jgi:phage shock protein PspC (stress-responsive transcriptional regulator)